MSEMGKRYVLPVTGRKEASLKLRKWQKAAIDRLVSYIKAGKTHALIAACPGAGKTQFTIAAWQDPEVRGNCDAIVVVVPSKALKRQWKKAFERNGIGAIAEIPNDHLKTRAYQDEEMFDPARPVQIYTYAQIAQDPELFRVLSAKHKVMAVFDEIHHADDEEAFGKSLVYAFEEAVFKLSLSGTPFNTKAGRLAFCETEEVCSEDGRKQRRTVADFSYSYADALSAEGTDDDPDVVRPVQFVRWNGIARWQRTYLDSGLTVENITTGRRKNDQLWPLLAVDSEGTNNCKRMIDAAVDRLEEIREHHSNAAMLITAMDRDHCEQIAAYLKSKGIHDHKVIMHDTPRAADAIRDFEIGKDRVLIAIKMISEGVDIKRLRVGVYASNVMTQMFFIQFVGRFIRWDGSLPANQFACVFIPEHVTLIKYAVDIERMVIEAESGRDDPPPPPPPPPPTPESIVTGIDSTGSRNGIIERSKTIEEKEIEKIEAAIKESGFRGSAGEASQFLAAYLKHSAPHIAIEITGNQESDISKLNDKLIGRWYRACEIAGKSKSYAELNKMANLAVGIARKDSLTPHAKLQERAFWIRKKLVAIRSETDATA